MAIALVYSSLIILTAVILYVLNIFGVESIISKRESKAVFAMKTSVNVCLKAFVSKGSNTGFKSHTYKIVVTTLVTLGFIMFTYYKATLKAALFVNVENLPINSWEDVHESDHKRPGPRRHPTIWLKD